ncbi:MAG: methyltransferase domain-containing protein [Gammaproteobacteria bacterium]|nr:methyltransferase domain-containing protein [Gammaproteobacteria bacterium]
MTVKIKTHDSIMRDRNKITRTISHFWDQISEGWREIWGPHIHHGYYEYDQPLTPLEAQEKLIEKLTAHLSIHSHSTILDVGCGMGGSSLHLAKRFNAIVTGITLSPKQVAIATQQAKAENIHNVNFKIEDALFLKSFADNSFDIVWSLESCEQFYNKALFLQEAFRVLKPGGKLMLATWCSSAEEYLDKEADQYKKLCFAFDVPYMPTINHYQGLLVQQGFKVEQTLDWSSHVAKSWDIGVSLVSAYSFLRLLRLSGWRGFRFARQIKMMRDAFHQKRVKYGVFFAAKP